VLAFLIRLHRISDPALDFHPTRQFRSFIIARGLYLEDGNRIDGIDRKAALEAKKEMGSLEPPIMENITRFAYEIYGGERLWIPRVFTILFWLLGGIALYFIALRFLSRVGAIFSLSFYLFLPFGVVASRSFQPDSLMIMAELSSILFLIKYYENGSRLNGGSLFFFTSLALIVKPVSIFILFWIYICYFLFFDGRKRTYPILFFLSLIPTLAYYLHGILMKNSFLNYQAGGSFIPALWFMISYWKGWISIIGKVVGYPALFASLVGTLYLSNERKNLPILFWWIGYINFGIIFNYHIHTHDYYQLQLIPLVAIGTGVVFQMVISNLRFDKMRKTILYLILFLSVIIYSLVSVAKSYEDSTGEIKQYVELGRVVNHTSHAIFYVDGDLELFFYYGNMSGVKFPSKKALEIYKLRGLKVESNPIKLTDKYIKDGAKYLIIWSIDKFIKDKDYREYVEKNFELVKREDRFIVYRLR
jgi:hypothetical protein